jgi:hypothetical protein
VPIRLSFLVGKQKYEEARLSQISFDWSPAGYSRYLNGALIQPRGIRENFSNLSRRKSRPYVIGEERENRVATKFLIRCAVVCILTHVSRRYFGFENVSALPKPLVIGVRAWTCTSGHRYHHQERRDEQSIHRVFRHATPGARPVERVFTRISAVSNFYRRGAERGGTRLFENWWLRWRLGQNRPLFWVFPMETAVFPWEFDSFPPENRILRSGFSSFRSGLTVSQQGFAVSRWGFATSWSGFSVSWSGFAISW